MELILLSGVFLIQLIFDSLLICQRKHEIVCEKRKLLIDCNNVVKDGVFDVAAFQNFLNDRFKLNGKTGNLGTAVAIEREGSSVAVSATIQYPKSYLKYLTKKFLKKQQLRDWIHVVATKKDSYELKYFKVGQETTPEDKE